MAAPKPQSNKGPLARAVMVVTGTPVQVRSSLIRKTCCKLWGRIRAFVTRILGFRVTEFGLEFGLSWGGIGCRGKDFGVFVGEAFGLS